ncbi:MAG TPA: SDR family NAD(P)-dependent oxidoreductase [Candidatus Solibacter sp.]|nr:SDR family NAD(P)-dependent oxidoreductase [Candidatus Solibacter sp.]
MSGAFSLEGKVALVTGGARGIGLAIVEELLGRGAQIVIADSGVSISGDQPDTKVAEQAAVKLGTRTAAFASDIASPDMADAAVKLAVEHFGALDIIVNNGAILRDAFIFKSARADWQRVIDNNLTGAWSVLAAATPVLREAVKSGRSPGRIVNIVSSAGLYGNFGQAAYAASKAGLWGLTRVVAMDMARSGVLCNAVAPFAATRVTESIQPANDAQVEYKRRALAVPAAYVARLVGWLVSPGCAASGQLFGVRGREVFLFSQPRPAARIVTEPLDQLTPERLDAAIAIGFIDQYTDLKTDLEMFNTEPLI